MRVLSCVLFLFFMNALFAIQSTVQWYANERALLSQEEIYSILDKGAELATQSDLTQTLASGGSALFPHCSIVACGDQVSAVVHSCLEACIHTKKNQILMIGVLHPITPILQNAARMAREGMVIGNPCRGIFGPGLPQEELLCEEFSLDNFVFLLEHAVKRKGIPMPKILLRYPCFVFGQPDHLPGLEELRQLARESIVVATSDLFHYGTAYSYYGKMTNNPDEKIPISEKGYAFARETIQKNLHLLSKGNWQEFMQYCSDTSSDGSSTRQVLTFLLGPLEGTILDLRLVDVSHFFEKPPPNWVATALVALKPK
jgi:hypothetical protein